MSTEATPLEPAGDGFELNAHSGNWDPIRASVAFGHLYIESESGGASPGAGTTQSIALTTIESIADTPADSGFVAVTMLLSGHGTTKHLRLRPSVVEAVAAGRANPESTLDLSTVRPPPLPPVAPAPPAPWLDTAPPSMAPPAREAPWSSAGPSMPLPASGISCTICNQPFVDIGSLTQHHQAMHSGSGNAVSTAPPRSNNRLTWMIAAAVVAVVAVALLAANAGGRSDAPTASTSGSSSSSSRSSGDSYSPPLPDNQDLLDEVWDSLSYSDRSNLCDAVDQFGVDFAAAAIMSESDGTLSLSDLRTFLTRKC